MDAKSVKFGPTGEYGIKELTELTEFLVAGIVVGDQQLADGFQSTDLLAFFQLLPLGVRGFEGIGQIPNEIADFTPEEAVEYMKVFDRLDLRDDAKEALAIVCLKEVADVGESIATIAKAVREYKLQKAS